MVLNRDSVKRIIASVDWGFTNPGTIQVWIVDNDGRMFLIEQIYQSGKTIDWWVSRAKDLHKKYTIEAFVCDPSEPGFIKQFQNGGLVALKANNDVSLGIAKVKERMMPAKDGRPRLFALRDSLVEVDPQLRMERKPLELKDEIPGYVWANHQTKEVPVKEDDHGVDAMRYAVMYVDAGPAKPAGTEVEIDPAAYKAPRRRR